MLHVIGREFRRFQAIGADPHFKQARRWLRETVKTDETWNRLQAELAEGGARSDAEIRIDRVQQWGFKAALKGYTVAALGAGSLVFNALLAPPTVAKMLLWGSAGTAVVAAAMGLHETLRAEETSSVSGHQRRWVWHVAGTAAAVGVASALLPAGIVAGTTVVVGAAALVGGGALHWYGTRLHEAATLARALERADARDFQGKYSNDSNGMKAWAQGVVEQWDNDWPLPSVGGEDH